MSNNQNMSDEVSEHSQHEEELVEEPVIKKEKETFENIMKQIKEGMEFIKQSNKDINELDKQLKLKEKDKHDRSSDVFFVAILQGWAYNTQPRDALMIDRLMFSL